MSKDHKMQTGSPAGLLRRLTAYIIDWYLATMVCGAPLMLVNSMRTGLAAPDSSLPPGAGGFVWGTVAIVLGGLYYWGIPLLWQGATPGKKLMHLRIVMQNPEELLCGRSLFLRQIVGLLFLEGAVTFPSQLFREILARLAGQGVSEAVRIVMVAITVISVMLGIYTSGHKMIHDRISGTMEIMDS